MSATDRPSPPTLSIAAVGRDTGLSKDTLRVWERRYGFPSPARDALGERAYAPAQVERLRLIKRLLDAGHRPGKLVRLDDPMLRRLGEATIDKATPAGVTAVQAEHEAHVLGLLRAHDPQALRRQLAQDMARHGVPRFLVDVLAPLNVAVGRAWASGQLEMFEEHLYTEVVQALLRQDIAASASPGRAPRVLLSTVPGEPHGLGLLMVEAMLALESAAPVSLGLQTPVWDLVLAARAYRVDVLALSFTGCTSAQATVEALTELRASLPASVALWAGGSAPALRRRSVAGVQVFERLDALPAAVNAWRAAKAADG